jgi:hypothetical protein
MFGLALLGLAALFVAGRLVIALRRPAQRAALPGLLRSPAALAVLGHALQEAARDDRPTLDAFCRQHGFERWARRRRMPRPWRRRRAADTLVVPEAWADAAEDLVASLRRLGGSIEVLAAGSGWLDGRPAVIADACADDVMRVAIWLDARRAAGEIAVTRPPLHQLTRRREVRYEPRLTPPGLVVTISPEVADGEPKELLRPLDLVHHPLAEGGELVLRFGTDGLLVAVPLWRAEEVGFDALAELAVAATTAAQPGSARFAAYRA